jgi:hypothetical protein
MLGQVRSHVIRKRAGMIAALTMAATIVAGSVAATPALADDPVEFPVSFAVTGSTVVKKTDSTINLGPGQLTGAIVVNGDDVGIRGDLSLPPSTANISLASGIFRIRATVKVTPVAPVSGVLKDGDLLTHAQVNMEINNIVVGVIVPVIPLPTVPSSCKTVSPIDMNLITKDVDLFAPTITQTGTYTIPAFKNCFIADLALGSLVSGPDNTISLTLTSNS